MPASKRRRAAAARRSPAAVPVATPPVEVPASPAKAVSTRPSRSVRARPLPDPDAEPPWSPLGLLVLLGLVVLAQMPIGAVLHTTSHTNLLVIDLFFFQPQFVLLAAVLVMPLARILTHQPRRLRLLECLSLGAVYALLALLLTTVLVHPNNGSESTDQFMRHLQVGDGIRIALGDVLAVAGTVVFFPGINRVLSAPGRRARRRMLERNAASAKAGGGASRPTRNARARR